MGTFKRGIAVVLLLILLAGMLPSQVFATESEICESVFINPLYEAVLTEEDLVFTEDTPMLMADDTYTSLESAAAAVAEALMNRQPVITVYLQTQTAITNAKDVLLDKAMEHTGIPGQGDNLRYQFGGGRVAHSESVSGGTYYYYVRYTPNYMSSADQEAQVATATAALRQQLELSSKTDVQKILAVYNWMCDNITYDYAGLEDSSDYLEYTAYDAIINRSAVCQGYANLFYRIMLEEGIDCRIVSGTSNGEAHAWNIVKIGSLYYNVDATWDANWKCRYFLKGSTNFNTDHTSGSDYTAAAFTSRYPIDPNDYVVTMRSGSVGASVNWSIDNTGCLTISGTGAMADYAVNTATPWYGYYMCIDRAVVEDGITYVGDRAFQALPITEAKVGKDVTALGDYAFGSCRKLTAVSLPEKVSNVAWGAFYDCPKLTSVVFCGTQAQWNAITLAGSNAPLTSASRKYHNYVNGVCTVCNDGLCNRNGHQWTAATCTAPKTCSVCFTTEGAAKGHSWVDADCDTPKTCSVCFVTEGAAKGHSWVDADCDTPKTCSVCFTTEGEAKGHSWVEVNCESPKSCSVCGAASDEILGHDWVAADCDEPKHCSRCPATEGAANGHSWVAADCDTPKTCSVCFATEGAAKGHSWVDADCDTPKTCSVCFVTEGAANGHSFGDWATVTPATDTTPGLERRDCRNCDHYETRALPRTGNILLLTGDLAKETVVYIDGQPYPVQTEDGSCYVELPSDQVSVMVTYTYHAGNGSDVHTQYPTGMKVYRVAKTDDAFTAAHIPELDNLLQYSGSSIRITGKKGIRMITSLTKANKSALTGSGLAGFKLLEYGTALCWATDLTDGKDLTLGQSYTRSNYAYKKGVADPVFATTGNLTQYTNVLVGFSNEQCKPDIVMRPYIILQDAAGKQVTLYGGSVHRSVGYIAYQNRNVFKSGSASYKYVWDIIHAVYGNTYDAEFKG